MSLWPYCNVYPRPLFQQRIWGLCATRRIRRSFSGVRVKLRRSICQTVGTCSSRTMSYERCCRSLPRQQFVRRLREKRRCPKTPVGAFGDFRREARKPTHVDFVETQSDSGADRIVELKFDVRQMRFQLILTLTDNDSQLLRYRGVNTLHTDVVESVVGAAASLRTPRSSRQPADASRKTAPGGPLSCSTLCRHPHTGVHGLIRTPVVPSAVVSAAVTASIVLVTAENGR